jgi:hypothetical protein
MTWARTMATSWALVIMGAFGGCTASTSTGMVLQPKAFATIELDPRTDWVILRNDGPGAIDAAMKDFSNRVHTAITLEAGREHEQRTTSTGRVDLVNRSDRHASVRIRVTGGEGLKLNVRTDAPPSPQE